MKVKTVLRNDTLYVRLDESVLAESEEVKPRGILDYEVNNKVIGTGKWRWQG